MLGAMCMRFADVGGDSGLGQFKLRSELLEPALIIEEFRHSSSSSTTHFTADSFSAATADLIASYIWL